MTNPLLKKLGYSDNDRVVVFHADDIGMCQASVEAYERLLGNSPLSSASTMVACPWFPAAAQLFRRHGSNPILDIGVHLTQTSEWDAMRWGPVTTGDPASGLLDDEGYFYRGIEPAQTLPALEAVVAELKGQITRAQRAGIDMTHIDSHMGVVFCQRYLPHYAALGFEFGVPALAARAAAEQLVARGFDLESAEKLAAFSHQLEALGMPLFDGIVDMPLRDKFGFAERLEHAKQILDSAPAGVYYFIIHPCVDSAEIRALAPDWKARVGDLNLFLSDEWQRVVDASGYHVIGMKQLRSLMNNE